MLTHGILFNTLCIKNVLFKNGPETLVRISPSDMPPFTYLGVAAILSTVILSYQIGDVISYQCILSQLYKLSIK